MASEVTIMMNTDTAITKMVQHKQILMKSLITMNITMKVMDTEVVGTVWVMEWIYGFSYVLLSFCSLVLSRFSEIVGVEVQYPATMVVLIVVMILFHLDQVWD